MWMFYVVFGSFSYIVKVFIKDVSNTTANGSSITIVYEENNQYIGSYSFLKKIGI